LTLQRGLLAALSVLVDAARQPLKMQA